MASTPPTRIPSNYVPFTDNSSGLISREWYRYLSETNSTSANASSINGGAAGEILYQTAPSTTGFVPVAAAGSALRFNGSIPSWSVAAALSVTSDVNVVLSTEGSPGSALLEPANISVSWSGVLGVNRGGTGLASYNAQGVLYAANTTSLASSPAFKHDGNTIGLGVAPDPTVQYRNSYENSYSAMQIVSYGTEPRIICGSASGTISSPGATTNNQISIQGLTTSDGNAFSTTSTIVSGVNGTIVPGSHPTALAFGTTPVGSTSYITRMLIVENGDIFAGGGQPSMTGGFFCIPAATSVPTGAPPNYPDRSQLYYDKSNKMLWINDQGWKNVSAFGPFRQAVQTGSKTQDVTLNGNSGRIITSNSLMNAGQSVSFDLRNSFIGSNSVVTLTKVGFSFTQDYELQATNIDFGLCVIVIKNVSSNGLSDVIQINFIVQSIS
jgi:hypothetical protein